MKTKLFLAIAIVAASAFGQTALTSTTITNAITVNQQTFAVASTSGITVGTTRLYILDKGGQGRGELTGLVTALPTTTSVTVSRGSQFRAAHVALSVAVIINSAQAIQNYDPVGSCTAANTLYTPWINQSNGNQWLCSTKTLAWVPGFNNSFYPKNPTADVASAAGLPCVKPEPLPDRPPLGPNVHAEPAGWYLNLPCPCAGTSNPGSATVWPSEASKRMIACIFNILRNHAVRHEPEAGRHRRMMARARRPPGESSGPDTLRAGWHRDCPRSRASGNAHGQSARLSGQGHRSSSCGDRVG